MVLSGHSEAFDPLVTPYRQSLLTLAFRLTRNWEDAKEVAQEALLRAFRYLGRYDRSRSFRNWLFQIAANEARDRLRRGRREADIVGKAGRELAPGDDPESVRRAAEFRSDVERCLSVLGAREREVFVLRDLEELNIKETARVLGCSNVSVRVNLSSARRKIRDAIRQFCPHLEEGR